MADAKSQEPQSAGGIANAALVNGESKIPGKFSSHFYRLYASISEFWGTQSNRQSYSICILLLVVSAVIA